MRKSSCLATKPILSCVQLLLVWRKREISQFHKFRGSAIVRPQPSAQLLDVTSATEPLTILSALVAQKCERSARPASSFVGSETSVYLSKATPQLGKAFWTIISRYSQPNFPKNDLDLPTTSTDAVLKPWSSYSPSPVGSRAEILGNRRMEAFLLYRRINIRSRQTKPISKSSPISWRAVQR